MKIKDWEYNKGPFINQPKTQKMLQQFSHDMAKHLMRVAKNQEEYIILVEYVAGSVSCNMGPAWVSCTLEKEFKKAGNF